MRILAPLVVLFAAPLPAVASLPASAPTTRPIHEIVTGSPDVFPISFWCGPPRNFVNVERYQQIKDAGFTFIMPDGVGGHEPELQKKILDTAQQVGLKAFITDNRMPHGIAGSAEAKKRIDDIVADYKDHRALAGYYITDEPGTGMFPALGETFAYLQEKDPDHPAYINLLPNYAPLDYLGTPTYDAHVEQFVKIVKPKLLCYDHYGFLSKYDRPGFFANLETFRNQSLKSNLPFWQIVLLINHGDYRNTTEAEKRWEAWNTLAYGGKGLLFFTYWTPDKDPIWGEACFTLDGKPTKQYEHVKRINKDVQAVGKHLLRATSIGVMQQGRPGDNTRTADDLPVDFEGPNITAGYFKDGDARLMLLVNRDYRNPLDTPTTLRTGGKPLSKLDKATGKWEPVDGETAGGEFEFPLKLAPGDADLFRW